MAIEKLQFGGVPRDVCYETKVMHESHRLSHLDLSSRLTLPHWLFSLLQLNAQLINRLKLRQQLSLLLHSGIYLLVHGNGTIRTRNFRIQIPRQYPPNLYQSAIYIYIYISETLAVEHTKLPSKRRSQIPQRQEHYDLWHYVLFLQE